MVNLWATVRKRGLLVIPTYHTGCVLHFFYRKSFPLLGLANKKQEFFQAKTYFHLLHKTTLQASSSKVGNHFKTWTFPSYFLVRFELKVVFIQAFSDRKSRRLFPSFSSVLQLNWKDRSDGADDAEAEDNETTTSTNLNNVLWSGRKTLPIHFLSFVPIIEVYSKRVTPACLPDRFPIQQKAAGLFFEGAITVILSIF